MSDVNAAIQSLVTSLIQQSLPAIVQAVQAQLGATAPVAAPAPVAAAPVAAADPFAGLGAPAAAAPVTVTPEMVQALVMPLIANETAKAMLMQAMAAQGVTSLPEATPAQLPGLYAAFQQIDAQFRGAGAAAPAAAAPVTTII